MITTLIAAYCHPAFVDWVHFCLLHLNLPLQLHLARFTCPTCCQLCFEIPVPSRDGVGNPAGNSAYAENIDVGGRFVDVVKTTLRCRALQNTIQAMAIKTSMCRALPFWTMLFMGRCAALPRLHSHRQAWLAEIRMHQKPGCANPKRGQPCSYWYPAPGLLAAAAQKSMGV